MKAKDKLIHSIHHKTQVKLNYHTSGERVVEPYFLFSEAGSSLRPLLLSLKKSPQNVQDLENQRIDDYFRRTSTES